MFKLDNYLRNLLNFVGSKVCHPVIYVGHKDPSSLIPQTLRVYVLCARHCAGHWGYDDSKIYLVFTVVDLTTNEGNR